MIFLLGTLSVWFSTQLVIARLHIILFYTALENMDELLWRKVKQKTNFYIK